jgi:hypothetical protein
MLHSARKFRIGAMVVASLGTLAFALTIRVSAWAQSTSPQAPARSETQSCWHPGLRRNIGIAELSCDALAPDQSNRPESKDAGDARAHPKNRGSH